LTYADAGRGVVTDGASTYSASGIPLWVAQGGVASVAVTDLHTDLNALLDSTTGALSGSRSSPVKMSWTSRAA
jgi:hypothetical protein